MTVAGTARVLLALVRLASGTTGLVAPARLATKIGVNPETSPGTLYVFRMFGIRTVLMAGDLLGRDEHARARALRRAPLVHASDTAAAAVAAASGRLPGRGGATITAISAVNTVLALLARRG